MVSSEIEVMWRFARIPSSSFDFVFGPGICKFFITHVVRPGSESCFWELGKESSWEC